MEQGEYNMLNKDINDNINILLAVTSSINDTYAKLKELEIKGQKESKEYKRLIECLKSSLELEKSIYDRFPNDLDTLVNIIREVTKNKDFFINFDLKENIDAIINNYDLITRRIYLRLLNKMLDIKDADFIIGTNNPDILENQSARNILILHSLIIKDYINTILVILNKVIYDEKYKNINNLLLNVKYSLAFLYDNVENDLLENNFNINNDLYWEATAMGDFYHLDREKLKEIQKGTVHGIYYEKIDNIIKTILNDKSCDKEIFIYAISEILIRACLLFYDDKTVECLKSNKIKLANNTKANEHNLKLLNDAQKRVDNVYSFYDQDKELIKVISLKVR